MKRTLIVFLSLLFFGITFAQKYNMRVTRNDGQPLEIPVDNINRVEFVPIETVKYGERFSSADIVAKKSWVDLGWSGDYLFEKWESDWYDKEPGYYPLSLEHGDIMGMPAFCGHEYIVIFARAYAIKGEPAKAFKVFDPLTLKPAGKLNLGSISPADVVAIASDWQGNMIAAVGRKVTGKSDLYIWTSPEDEPELLGSTHTSVEVSENNDNAASYINVAGDLTGDAVIAFGGPRDADGTHYKYKVSGGKLNSAYEVIKTGHSSEDQYKFQMISYFGVKDTDPYLVGDCYLSFRSDTMEDEVGVYLNGPDGKLRAYAEYYATAYNGWVNDLGDSWWQRTGQTLKREGGRRPTVHAMHINGRDYAFWTTGSLNTVRTLIADPTFWDYYTDYGCFWGCGKTTGEMVGTAYMWRRDCYGSMADWYFDESTQHGYIALWMDRIGLIMFELSCAANK